MTVRAAQHVVGLGVLTRHLRERHIESMMLAQKFERAPDARQHAEREHIDFQQPERRDVVLVPFDESAVIHCRIANRHHLHRAAPASARTRRRAARDGAENRSALQ